jgi:hypothetical protein
MQQRPVTPVKELTKRATAKERASVKEPVEERQRKSFSERAASKAAECNNFAPYISVNQG